jgi:hypothetical protein
VPAKRRARRAVEDDEARARTELPAPGVAHEGLDPPGAADELQVVIARHDEAPAVARGVIRVRCPRAAEVRVASEGEGGQHEACRGGGGLAERAHGAGRRATSQVTAPIASAGR